MAQDFTYAQLTDTLEASHPLITDQFEALRSSFSGTSFPTSPVAGQPFYNTSTKAWYMTPTDSGTPNLMFYADKPYGGLLPLTATSAYPLSGDLYMGGKNIKNLAAPTADTDACTKGYARDSLLSTHSHGGGTDGLQIPYSNVTGTGAIGNVLLQLNSAGTTAEYKVWNVNSTATAQTVTPTMTTLASCTAAANANEKKLIIAGAWCELWTDEILGTAHPNLQVLRDTTAISGPTHYGISTSGSVLIVTSSTPLTAATYTWTLQGALDNLAGATASWYASFLIVI